MQPCPNDNKTFFEKLQNAEGLDLRDNRGKRHDLAVVLVGVAIAVLSNRDGNLSAIHRHLSKRYEQLIKVLEVPAGQAVSRSQLPIILEKVAVEVFDDLLFEHFGIKLPKAMRRWFSIDGKELCGSIEKGARRGEAVVQVIAHETLAAYAQDYYSGDKESEVPIVRKLLADKRLANQKITLDALHCKPKTLAPIADAGGTYGVGVKKNQKELFWELVRMSKYLSCLYQTETLDKGHGRIEQRRYRVYDLAAIYKDERWNTSDLKTAVKVSRERQEIRTGKISRETSYYVSNQTGEFEQLCQAVRNHWSIETNNHIRDVTLKEDRLRTKKSESAEC
jgi:predicted transposase YbfD/YdcC